MDLNAYQQLARQTSRFFPTEGINTDNMQMAALGLCGEAGELADLIKKHLYHGHELDMTKVMFELGDILWYVAEMCTAFNFRLNSVAAENIDKLQARYGTGFSTEASINRSK